MQARIPFELFGIGHGRNELWVMLMRRLGFGAGWVCVGGNIWSERGPMRH